MTRVIVHAGFYKTGTSSLQSYLTQHRDAFRPWFAFHATGDGLHRAAVTARSYGARPFPWRLRAFRHALRADLAGLPEAETVVISREQFSGALPGNRRLGDRYLRDPARVAIALARVIAEELRVRFGPTTEITFLYTTRETGAWLASLYGHLLRTSRFTQPYDVFRRRLPASADPHDIATRIARALPVPVTVRALEELTATRAGPAKAVLDLAGVPESIWQALPLASRANTGPAPDLQQAFLDLNRSDLPEPELVQRKKHMIAEADR